MISISELKGSAKTSEYVIGEIRGLSTDDKPIGDIDDREIMNGCVFIEMDTKKIYFYDAENEQWREF